MRHVARPNAWDAAGTLVRRTGHDDSWDSDKKRVIPPRAL